MFTKLIFNVFACISTLILLSNGNTEDMARVIGGRDVAQEDWYFMVGMYAQPRNYSPSASMPNFFYSKGCGGVIITEWHILTAAHCMFERKAKDVVFVAGSTEIKPYLQLHRKNQLYVIVNRDHERTYRFVKSLIPHPNYDYPKQTNDIGIVKVVKSFKFDFKKIGPIPLETMNQVPNSKIT